MSWNAPLGTFTAVGVRVRLGLRWLGALARATRPHLAIVKSGTPIVCVDEFGERFGMPRRPSHGQTGLELEISRNDRICRQRQMPNSGRDRDSAKSAVNHPLAVRIKMMANSEAIAVSSKTSASPKVFLPEGGQS
jgi:hypothetical protein